MVILQDLPDSIVHRSKRTQVYAERQQKSEGSVSSTYGDPGMVMAPAATRIRNEMPNIVVEQSLAHSVQNGKGKGLIEAMKKGRGARLKIDKETSCSNFVFVQSPCVTRNEIQCDRPVHCDGESGDELKGSRRQVRNGYGREKEVEVQKEKTDQDLLVESIFLLKTAQEVLEKVDSLKKSCNADLSYKIGLQHIFSRMAQKQRVESSYLKEPKAAFSEQTQIPYNSGDETVMFKKESWKRENREGIASADETLKRMCVCTSYFFVQLLLLLVILGVFVFQSSPNYIEVIPT